MFVAKKRFGLALLPQIHLNKYNQMIQFCLCNVKYLIYWRILQWMFLYLIDTYFDLFMHPLRIVLGKI